ncbi:MAG: hypothetical protein ACI9S8_000514 [Chlamydiales bacterium]|jgi:hypothetical protein
MWKSINQTVIVLRAMTTFLYSKTILTYLARVKLLARDILKRELLLSVRGERFSMGTSSYPLSFVVFEGNKRLGYFDYETFEIGINRHVMLMTKPEDLRNLLRHELAHYMMFIKYGHTVSAHGPEFRDLCKSYGWGEAVYASQSPTIDNPSGELIHLHDERILSKIQKILALTASHNPHEAEQATVKANSLLTKYNLREIHSLDSSHSQQFDEDMWVKRILKKKRSNAKLNSIISILRTFYVYPVLNYGSNIVYLEIFGSKTNTSIAEHVGIFLDQELEKLWLRIQKGHPHLKGLASKNSFMRGVAKGYCSKIESLKDDYSPADQKALIVLENKLSLSMEMAYPKLSHRSSSYQNCEKASEIGKKEGQKLQIQSCLEKSPKKGLISGLVDFFK